MNVGTSKHTLTFFLNRDTVESLVDKIKSEFSLPSRLPFRFSVESGEILEADKELSEYRDLLLQVCVITRVRNIDITIEVLRYWVRHHHASCIVIDAKETGVGGRSTAVMVGATGW